MKRFGAIFIFALISAFLLLPGAASAHPRGIGGPAGLWRAGDAAPAGQNGVAQVAGPVSIALVDPPANLKIGDKETLICVFTPDDTPDKTLIWESSDPEILSVDSNGVIEALSEGTALITVTAVNGVKFECVFLAYKESYLAYAIIIALGVGLFAFNRWKTMGRDTKRNKKGAWHESDLGAVDK